MPFVSVFVARTFETVMGTGPRSTFVKCNEASGPGNMVLNIGLAISMVILLPATLMLGHSCATMSFKNSRHTAILATAPVNVSQPGGPPDGELG